MNKNVSIENTTVIYEHIDSLSLEVLDYGYVVILPAVIIFSLVTNMFSVIVLAHSTLKKVIFKYMLLMCLFDFYTLVSSLWLAIIRCGSLCPYNYSYSFGAKIYELYFFLYLTNVSIFLSNVTDLHIALNRLFSFSVVSRNTLSYFSKKIPLKWQCVIWMVAAFILALPNYILSRSIQQIGFLSVSSSNRTTTLEPLYLIRSNSLGNKRIAKFFLLVISILRKPCLLIALCVINLIMGYKFKQHLKDKEKILPVKPSNSC